MFITVLYFISKQKKIPCTFQWGNKYIVMCQYNAVLHSNHSKQISGTMTVQIGLKSMLSGTGRNKGMQTLWIHWLIIWDLNTFSSVQFISVAQSHANLCDPMNRSMPGLPVHKQLPESTQTQVYWLVMPSSHLILCRPLLLLPPIPPSIRVFSNESSLHMRWPSTGVSASASVLPMNTQDWPLLGWTSWISLQSNGLLRVFSNTTVQKHQFFSAQLSSQSNSHIHTDHWKNQSLD